MSVRSLRRGSIAASRAAGGGGTPTTYTIYGAVADGYIQSNSTSYATARSGGLLTANTAATSIYVGQQLISTTYSVYEGFLAFDTSSVVGTITAVTLSLRGNDDGSATDFTLEARLHDWDTSLTTADFVAGDSLGAKTLLASYATSSGWSTAGYNALTSEAAFLSNINQSGVTRLVLCSDRTRLSNAPTVNVNEYVGFASGDATGTTQDPKLVIEALV